MSDIKQCFVSRFPEGRLVEVDFSQLEVIGLALLSNDPVLKSDILSGMDMHRLRAAELFNVHEWEVTKEQRTLAKRLSFQLQYGAGAKSMAAKNGIDKGLAQAFIDNYYARYTRVKEWQNEVADTVWHSRQVSERKTKLGYPAGSGKYVSVTGREYVFFEYDGPTWMKDPVPSFSPTEMKNYPIQGFATADIMALFRMLVFRRIFQDGSNHAVKMINTVHDSVMFDCENELWADYICSVCSNIAESLPEEIEKRWKIVVDLPLKLSSKIGPTWASLG